LCCGDVRDRARTILLLRNEAYRISQKTVKTIGRFAKKTGDFKPYIYQMKKTTDGKCIFLTDRECTIYQIRPLICRFYPFELHNVGYERYAFAYTDECPCFGKGPELDKKHFEKLFAEFMRKLK
jgi:Fe-S-cluster containining protein